MTHLCCRFYLALPPGRAKLHCCSMSCALPVGMEGSCSQPLVFLLGIQGAKAILQTRLLMALSAAGGALAFLAVISLLAQTPGPSLGVGIRQCKQQESDAAKSGDSSALQTDA